MKNIGTIILILILIGVIGFIMYYVMKSKKEEKQQVQKAAAIIDKDVQLSVIESLSGMDLTDNVRKFGQS